MTSIDDVIKNWQVFQQSIQDFKKENNMEPFNGSPFEICTALGDKHGRICRQVKHKERQDAKPDWPKGFLQAMAGYLNYMMMLCDLYDKDLSLGLREELESSLHQYAQDDSDLQEIPCYSCQGDGCHKTLCKNSPTIPCFDCNCTGKITVDPSWKTKGEEMKNARKKAFTTLRECCLYLELDPCVISKMERGFIKPDQKILTRIKEEFSEIQ